MTPLSHDNKHQRPSCLAEGRKHGSTSQQDLPHAMHCPRASLPISVLRACELLAKPPTARMPDASAGARSRARCMALMYREPQPLPSQWLASSASSAGSGSQEQQ